MPRKPGKATRSSPAEPSPRTRSRGQEPQNTSTQKQSRLTRTTGTRSHPVKEKPRLQHTETTSRKRSDTDPPKFKEYGEKRESPTRGRPRGRPTKAADSMKSVKGQTPLQSNRAKTANIHSSDTPKNLTDISTDSPRRSSRQRNCKSALELLGLTKVKTDPPDDSMSHKTLPKLKVKATQQNFEEEPSSELLENTEMPSSEYSLQYEEETGILQENQTELQTDHPALEETESKKVSSASELTALKRQSLTKKTDLCVEAQHSPLKTEARRESSITEQDAAYSESQTAVETQVISTPSPEKMQTLPTIVVTKRTELDTDHETNDGQVNSPRKKIKLTEEEATLTVPDSDADHGDTIVVIQQEGVDGGDPIVVRITAEGEVRSDVEQDVMGEALSALSQHNQGDRSRMPISLESYTVVTEDPLSGQQVTTKDSLLEDLDVILPLAGGKRPVDIETLSADEQPTESPPAGIDSSELVIAPVADLPKDSITRKAFLTSRLLAKVRSEGGCRPMTDQDIEVNMNPETGRARPTQQLVVTKDLQALVDNIKPSLDLSEHVEFLGTNKRGKMKCLHCGELIAHRHHFRSHMRTAHASLNYKPFKCPLCDYTALIKAAIARHINTHSTVKPYVCTVCGKGFTFKQKLQLHMKYHKDLRDYICPLCKMAFHEHRTLRNHVEKVHHIPNPTEFIHSMSSSAKSGKLPLTLGTQPPPARRPSGQESIRHPGEEQEEGAGQAVAGEEGGEEMMVVEQGVETYTSVTMEELATALGHQGGTVVREADGSLVLITGPKVTQPEASKDEGTEGEEAVTEEKVQESKDQKDAINHAYDQGAECLEVIELEDGKATEAVHYEMVNDKEDEQQESGSAGSDTTAHTVEVSQAEGDKASSSEVVFVVEVQDDTQTSIDHTQLPEASQADSLVESTANSQETTSTDMSSQMCVEVVTIDNADDGSGQGKEDADNTSQKSTESQGEERPKIVVLHRNRRSRIKGPRKTMIQTKRFNSMGLTPNEIKRAVSKLNQSKSGSTKEASPQKPGPRALPDEPAKNAVNRVKNQRCTKPEQVEPELLQYCVVSTEKLGNSSHAKSCVQFTCLLCTDTPRVFPSKSQFATHMEQVHQDIRVWRCKFCNYNCRLRTAMIVHMKIHTGEKIHKCHICGKSFLHKHKLTNHIRHHENLRQYKCPQCPRAFNETNDLTKHIARVHVGLRLWACEVCDKRFKDRTQLSLHLATHDEGKKHQCKYCQRMYRSVNSLRQHMKGHTCMFHCEICDRNYTSYSGFMAHKVMHDESYEGYKCTQCDATLHTKGSLNRHHRIVHSDERKFICSVCDHAFKTLKDLKSHSLCHATEKLHRCDICDFSCKRLDSLKVHMHRHASQKPYQCGVCGKQYTQKHPLQMHLAKHSTTKERCPCCPKEFNNKYLLQLHVRRAHHIKIDFNAATPQLITGADDMQLTEEETVAVGDQEEDNTMTVFMCEECNSVFLTQDALAGHILAAHMKQGSATSSGSWPLKLEGEEGLEAPDATVEVTATVVGDDQPQTVTCMLPEALPSESAASSTMFQGQPTVESQISITSPSSNAPKIVTLIHPVEGEEQVVVEDTVLATSSHEAVQGSSTVPTVSQKVLPAEIPSHDEAATDTDKPMAKHKEQEEETMVTFTDPNTNQEYMVAMPPGALESLLAVSELETGAELELGHEVVTAVEELPSQSSIATQHLLETEVPLSEMQVEHGSSVVVVSAEMDNSQPSSEEAASYTVDSKTLLVTEESEVYTEALVESTELEGTSADMDLKVATVTVSDQEQVEAAGDGVHLEETEVKQNLTDDASDNAVEGS